MEIRKTQRQDWEAVLGVYEEAKRYFRKEGICQWQDGYPNRESLEKDCRDGISYVVEEEGQVIATAAVSFGRDKSYDAIYEGNWISREKEYGIVHRIAVLEKKKGQGIAGRILQWAEEMCCSLGARYIRIDTHEDNISMQRLLEKSGYQRCGIIYLEDGSGRAAFEKEIGRGSVSKKYCKNSRNMLI